MSEAGIAMRLQTAIAARVRDHIARGVFLVAGLSVFGVLGFIIWTLFSNTALFLGEVSIVEFLTGTDWYITESNQAAYGILPLVGGTLLVTFGAILLGLPVGLATAIYLAEYASPRVRGVLKPVLEILAGVPSIVFGYFALRVVSPIVQRWTEPGTLLASVFGTSAGVFSAANSIIVVGIMVLPIITSLSEDALRAVPRHLREASLGLGATKWETTRKVVLPAALSGITASFVLAVARAIGETMAVSMASGSSPNFTINPLESIQTMTAFIVQQSSGDVPQEGVLYTSLFAVGAALFVMTLGLNLLAQRFIKKYREVDVA